jgi:hypothetical protein
VDEGDMYLAVPARILQALDAPIVAVRQLRHSLSV